MSVETSRDDKVVITYSLDKKDLSCGICYNSLTGQIYRCRNGNHNICGSCKQRVDRCALCKDDVLMRDLSLEQHVRRYVVPCKNSGSGCREFVFLWDNEHFESCLYKPVSCFMCGSMIEYNNAVLLVHFRDKCMMSRYIRDVEMIQNDDDGLEYIILQIDVVKQQKSVSSTNDLICKWIHRPGSKICFISCGPALSNKYVRLTGTNNLIKYSYDIPIITNFACEVSDYILSTVDYIGADFEYEIINN